MVQQKILSKMCLVIFAVLAAVSWSFAVDTKDYVAGQLIVKLRANSGLSSAGKISALAAATQKYGALSVEPAVRPSAARSELDDLFLLRVAEDTDVRQLAAQMGEETIFEFVQPNYLHRVSAVPNDPFVSRQDYLAQIGAFDAWDYSQGAADVIIGIIDTGMDYNHEDLAANVWQNSDETVDGLDNDNNGYVDDVRGWDFVDNAGDVAPGEDGDNQDNDPLDFHGHGTNVAGFASAAANNATGIAGIGWSCKLMPLRAGYNGSDGNGYLPSSAIIAAIKYAADNGADVLNASFGFALDDPAETTAFRYAFDRGLVIVKAAGNDNSDIPHSPGREDWILSVASVTSSDRKSSFSNYGSWVKISAPGSSVYTTSRGNKYASATGTSFSSPIVAGLAGLIKAAHPDWSPAEIMMHIVDTADNIDAVNPGYEGQLGKLGRVNAGAALSRPYASMPNLVVTRISVEDLVNGNGDLRINAGETCDLLVRLTNRWADAQNVTVTVSTTDPMAQVLNNSAFFSTIPGISSSKNYVDNTDQYFTIKVDAAAFPHNIKFQLHIAGDGGLNQTVDFQVAVEARLLFVDDDDGIINVEDYYFTALDSIGMPYDVWDRAAQGRLGARIRNYDLVIWSCESAFPTLDEFDRPDLQTYLLYNKKLFLAGQSIAWDLCAAQTAEQAVAMGYWNQYNLSNGRSKTFYEQYLHNKFVADASSYARVDGATGDPIGGGLGFSVFEPLRTVGEQSRDVIQATANSTVVFQYPDNQAGAIRSKNGNVVLFGFGGFEAVADEGARLVVLDRILHHLTGLHVDVDDLFYIDGQTEDFTVSAHVKATGPLTGVNLYWRNTRQKQFNKVALTAVSDTLYQGAIPMQPIGATVEYGVQAVAASGLYSPIKLKELKIESAAPTVIVLGEKRNWLSRRPYVTMQAEHVVALDTTSATAIFWTNGVAQDSIKLDFLGDNTFRGQLRGAFKFGDSLFYQFAVRDLTPSRVRGLSPVYGMLLGHEDFESGLDAWQTEAGGWGLETLRKKSGAYSLHESPNADYPPDAELIAVLKDGLDLSDLSEATLSLWTMYAIQPGDFGYWEASNDNGATWTPISEPITGDMSSAAFYQAEFSLNSFTGPGNTNVLIRFRFTSDAANAGPGWFIDDISILPYTTAVRNVAEALPAEFVLYENYPNPFNAGTIIRYALPKDADVLLVIYNTLGQKVQTLVQGFKPAGFHAMAWDGRDAIGELAPSGLYFYRLEAGEFSAVRKLMMIK